MKRLSAQRLAEVNECLREVYGAQDLDQFAETVPVAISRPIGADIVMVSEVNLGRKRIGWHYQPADLPVLKFRPIFEKLMNDDPVITWYAEGADGRAIKRSDLVSPHQFQSTTIYNEVYRHFNLNYQLAFALDLAHPTMVGVVFHRSSSNFSEEDRLTANVLRSHLVQAYRNAELMAQSQTNIALLTEGIEHAGRAVILVSRERGIIEASAKARRWLDAYFAWHGAASSRRLPQALDDWLAEQLRQRSDAGLFAHPALPFTVKTPWSTLLVRATVHDDYAILLLEEQRRLEADDPAFLRTLEYLGLGCRESQVLAWVAQGKTNPEIALILGISSRTVQTHLDRIYRKLDVQSRAAAVAKAMEARELAAAGS